MPCEARGCVCATLYYSQAGERRMHAIMRTVSARLMVILFVRPSSWPFRNVLPPC